jgi:hypothetical protein
MFPTIDLSMLNNPNSFVLRVFPSRIYYIGVVDSIPKFIYNNSFGFDYMKPTQKASAIVKKDFMAGFIVDLPFSKLGPNS